MRTSEGHPPPRECWHYWHTPPSGFLKCNTDAALFRDESRTGIGAVIRDEKGNFFAARSYRFHGLPPVRDCEALGLLGALEWVVESGLQQVIFETDAKLVVDAINSSEDDISEFGDIIAKCRAILDCHDFFSVQSVRRQANGFAHALAQQTRFNPCLISYFEVPIFLAPCMNNVCPLFNH